MGEDVYKHHLEGRKRTKSDIGGVNRVERVGGRGRNETRKHSYVFYLSACGCHAIATSNEAPASSNESNDHSFQRAVGWGLLFALQRPGSGRTDGERSENQCIHIDTVP